MSEQKQTPVRVLGTEELAALRGAHASLTAAQQRLTDAQTAVAEEETLFRACTIRLQRRYGMALGDSIALDTGVVTSGAPPGPNASAEARRPARGVGRAQGTGAGGLRADRRSLPARPANGARPDVAGAGAEETDRGRVSGPNDLPGGA